MLLNEEDIGSLVDDVEDENDNESDIDVEEIRDGDFEGPNVSDEEERETEEDVQSGDSAEWVWSDQLENVEVELFTQQTGLNVGEMDLDYTSDPYEFFRLYFPDSLVTQITEQTNLYAEQQQAPRPFKPVTESDINVFFYVNMMFGIHKMPALAMYWMKDPLLRVAAIADVISRDRYRQISRYFHLADSQQFIPRGQPHHDPLYKIRPAIDKVLATCQTYYSPGVSISIDEAMIAFRERLHFKQYVKNKPTPWGVKVWCCADPKNGYLLDFRFYTGKIEAPMPNGLGHHVVMDVGSRFLDKYYHFYYDNYFSSVLLVKDLLNRSTYSCATTRQNRKNWPHALKGKFYKGECRMRQFGNIVCTCWNDKRLISLISTNSSPEIGTATRRTKDGPQEKQIPSPVLHYNSNMGGVDLNDQLISYYPVRRKSMKQWWCCFWYLFEVALLNAYILYKSMPRPQGSKPMSHFDFHLSIARAL